MRAGPRLFAALCVALGCSAGLAQQVRLAGSMGSKALLVIDGQPHTLAVGQQALGVTLQQVDAASALVLVNGQSLRLQLGAAPARLAGTSAAPSGNSQIVLSAGSGGHFMTSGMINGRAVQFMVDSGATLVALSEREAGHIGLDLRKARRGVTQTANGTVPVHLLSLDSIRVGEVVLSNVPAVVVSADMPYVLLGNSFLQRFRMQRDGNVMRLELRP